MKLKQVASPILCVFALAVVLAAANLADVQTSVEPAHFHHVRLNVTDPDETIAFYTKLLGAVEVQYHGQAPGLFTERSFLLLNKVDEPPPYLPKSAISHIGWASIDGQSDYEWLKSQGVKELLELWTGGKNHRFDHVHLWATDVAEMAGWFRDHLGLETQVGPQPRLQDAENILAIRMGRVRCDNVGIVIFGRPDFDSRWWPGGSYKKEDGPEGEFQPTQGRAIDHIAFSYRDIEPVYERMRSAGVEIVEPITRKSDVGHRSFFAMAPDKLLVEIVEARPIPESSWE